MMRSTTGDRCAGETILADRAFRGLHRFLGAGRSAPDLVVSFLTSIHRSRNWVLYCRDERAGGGGTSQTTYVTPGMYLTFISPGERPGSLHVFDFQQSQKNQKSGGRPASR